MHSTSSSRVSAKRTPLLIPRSEWPARPTRCRRSAIERGLPSWTTRSTAPMSMPSSSDAVATITRSSPRFSFSSAASRSSRAMLPWCALTVPGPEARAEVVCHALGELAGVGEDERRAVLADQLDQPVVDLAPHLVGGDGRERVLRRLERQLPLAEVPDLHHGAGLTAGEEGGEVLQRLLRGGESDELRAAADQRLQPLQRQREVAAALVAGEGVDLVDDDGVGVAQRLPAPWER